MAPPQTAWGKQEQPFLYVITILNQSCVLYDCIKLFYTFLFKFFILHFYLFSKSIAFLIYINAGFIAVILFCVIINMYCHWWYLLFFLIYYFVFVWISSNMSGHIVILLLQCSRYDWNGLMNWSQLTVTNSGHKFKYLK